MAGATRLEPAFLRDGVKDFECFASTGVKSPKNAMFKARGLWQQIDSSGVAAGGQVVGQCTQRPTLLGSLPNSERTLLSGFLTAEVEW